MKVGVLTWHSQLNYGGVLQAWAHQEALRILGFDVFVLDWWFDEHNQLLTLGYDRMTFRQKLRMVMRGLLCLGDVSLWCRSVATRKWIRKNLKLTASHFHEWRDFSPDCDCISVGSDQVWTTTPFLKTFLLIGAPLIHAVAYAPSLGTLERLDGECSSFQIGLKNFSRLSLREKSGLDFVRALGYDAEIVADPTIMVGRKFWYSHYAPKTSNHMVVYIIGSQINEMISALLRFSEDSHCVVDIFVDAINNPFLLTSPFAGKRYIREWVQILQVRFCSRLRFHLAAAPDAFVKAISKSRFVISDSFHALMFSAIYDKNVRILRPANAERLKMFSRITDFSDEYVRGPLIASDIDAALHSFKVGESVCFDAEKIDSFSAFSRHWLENAIRKE